MVTSDRLALMLWPTEAADWLARVAARRDALRVAEAPFLMTCWPASVEASAAPTHTAVPAAKPLSRSDTAEPTKRRVTLETLTSLNRCENYLVLRRAYYSKTS
jgi:hypothetical protein